MNCPICGVRPGVFHRGGNPGGPSPTVCGLHIALREHADIMIELGVQRNWMVYAWDPSGPWEEVMEVFMPNTIKSQKQRNFLGAVASGEIKDKGLSSSKAAKILHDNKGTMGNKQLPKKVKK